MESFCHKSIAASLLSLRASLTPCLPKIWCISLAVMLGLSAQALETVSLLPDEGPSRALLEQKKPIYAETRGEVDVVFSNALIVFDQPNLLKEVQDAYCVLIAKDHEPEFTIQQQSTNTYFYVNKDGDRTDIQEVVRRQTSENTFDIIYYSCGKRFFGKYQAVIHVRISDGGEGCSSYTAAVYAYPENAFSRFFARHLGLVERFFRSKTEELTGIITTISCNLCEKVAEKPNPAQASDKASS